MRLVDLLDLGAGARRDAALALGVEHLRVAPLLRRHRRDDGVLTLRGFCRRDWLRRSALLILPMPGIMPSTPDMPPMLLHLLQLLGQVVEVELALLHLLGDLLGLLDVDRLRRLLDQADDVAHAEDAAGDALRDGSPRAHPTSRRRRCSLIGLPVTARIDSAAPPRASPSTRVRTMPVMPTRLVEGLGDVDGVLAGQAVGDEQRLVRVAMSRICRPSPPSALRRRGGGRRCRACTTS